MKRRGRDRGGKGVTFDDETITELTSEDVLAGENEFDETANNEPAFEEEEPETPETPEESETGTETEAKNKQKGERQSKKTEADKESQSKLLESISSHKAVFWEEQFNKLFKTAFGEADISLSDLKLPQLNMFNKLLNIRLRRLRRNDKNHDENVKGQNCTQELTGRDIFVGPNGSGKSTRIESVGISILGYVPGKGKKNEETFKLSTGNAMEVASASKGIN